MCECRRRHRRRAARDRSEGRRIQVSCGRRDTNAGMVGDTSGFRGIGFVRHGAVRFGCHRVGFNEAMAGSFAEGAGGKRPMVWDGSFA